MRNRAGHQPPPMPWGGDRAERAKLAKLPGVGEIRGLSLSRGRGPLFGTLAPLLGEHVPRPLRYLAPLSILRVQFQGQDGRAVRLPPGMNLMGPLSKPG